jgi:hypothetical protein
VNTLLGILLALLGWTALLDWVGYRTGWWAPRLWFDRKDLR